MIQEVLTYLILAAAFSFAGIKIVSVFFKPKKRGNSSKVTSNSGCGNCSADCAMKGTATSIASKCNPSDIKLDSSLKVV